MIAASVPEGSARPKGKLLVADHFRTAAALAPQRIVARLFQAGRYCRQRTMPRRSPPASTGRHVPNRAPNRSPAGGTRVARDLDPCDAIRRGALRPRRLPYANRGPPASAGRGARRSPRSRSTAGNRRRSIARSSAVGRARVRRRSGRDLGRPGASRKAHSVCSHVPQPLVLWDTWTPDRRPAGRIRGHPPRASCSTGGRSRR